MDEKEKDFIEDETSTDTQQSNEESSEQKGEEASKSEKTFTQDELDSIITKRLEKERKKMESSFTKKIEEEKRLASLSEEEKQKEIYKIEKEKFEKERQEFQKEKMLQETKNLLLKDSLPDTFAEYLVRDTAEATLDEINKFKDIFNTSLQAGVEKKIGGKTPGLSSGRKDKEADAFLKGFL